MNSTIPYSIPSIQGIFSSQDGVFKFLISFEDQMEVESVLIPFHKRFTVCLSTQVGCAMNCSFCFTGTQGLKRNLKAHEIVGQYRVIFQWMKDHLKKDFPHLLSPNIVFMGQGEPLHNVEELHQAILMLTDPQIVGLGHRQITLSTIGYLPGLKKLEFFPRINVAFSLHSPFQEERTQLIPINEKYPLREVISVLDSLPLLPRQFIVYEYVLLKDFNMTERHVLGLVELLQGKKALINLIPFNPFPGAKWVRPDSEEVEDFRLKLVQHKLRVMVRQTKGAEILAACGQLKVNHLSRAYAT